MSSSSSSLSATQPHPQHASPPPPTQALKPDPTTLYAHQKWARLGHQSQLYLAGLPPTSTVPAAAAPGPTSSTAVAGVQLGIPRPKRKRITPEQLEVLSNLFEYTDTPTFDLREAIGAKLGMSNREVQVWFQNRRAKVNRQRLAANPQPNDRSSQASSSLHFGRAARPGSPPEVNHGVSKLFNGEVCSATAPAVYGAAQPAFGQPAPGTPGQPIPAAVGHADSLTRKGSPSPQSSVRSEQRPESSSQARRSPTAGCHHPRHASPYIRTPPQEWYPRRGARERSFDQLRRPLMPRRASTEAQAEPITANACPAHAVRARWSSGCLVTSPQPFGASATDTQKYSLARPLANDCSYFPRPMMPVAPHCNTAVRSPREEERPSLVGRWPHSWPRSPAQACSTVSMSSSRSPSPALQETTATCVRVEDVAVDNAQTRPDDWTMNGASAGPLHGTRSCSAEGPSVQSLFASRYLPPLPTPSKPGPGSFPPPAALRASSAPQHQQAASTPDERQRREFSNPELRLPPLLRDCNADRFRSIP